MAAAFGLGVVVTPGLIDSAVAEPTGPTFAEPLFSDDFTNPGDGWETLAGTWSTVGGQLTQTDPDGYDHIYELDRNELGGGLAGEYDLSVTMRSLGDRLGGGVMIAQPQAGSRNGAYLIDFDPDDSILRWGTYDDETGSYVSIGGSNVGLRPAETTTLEVAVRTEATLVFLDGVYQGAFEAVPTEGGVGLVTSRSSVAFSNFAVASSQAAP